MRHSTRSIASAASLTFALFCAISAAHASGTLQFSAAVYTGAEGGGSVAVTITRNGGSGTIGAALTTSNVTAIAGSDYTSVSTLVTFPDSEPVANLQPGSPTSQTVWIPILNDDFGEDQETLTLTLSAPTGGATIGGPSKATVRIDDNDPPTAPVLTIGASANPKQLQLNWTRAFGATSTRALFAPHLRASLAAVSPNLSGTTTMWRHDVAVHRYQWRSWPRYRVDACNAYGCTSSSVVGLPDPENDLLDAIGYFKASNAEALDHFGGAVALSGDGNTLAVTADCEDSAATGVNGDQTDNSRPCAGAAYVFVRNALGAWSQQAYLKGPAAHFGEIGNRDNFSLALSGDGNTLAVAQRSDSAYIFTRAGGLWSHTYTFDIPLTTFIPSVPICLSIALSRDSNTFALGVATDTSGSAGVSPPPGSSTAWRSGAVYVFSRSAGSWSNPVYIKASNAHAGDEFGRSVALSGDGSVLSVGAPKRDVFGRVYVFTRSGLLWAEQTFFGPAAGSATMDFGISMALSNTGNVLAVGTEWNSNSSANDAYVFARSGSQWLEEAHLESPYTTIIDRFGRSVALNGDGTILAVGAPGDPNWLPGVRSSPDAEAAPFGNNNGAVHVYERSGSPAGWRYSRYVKAAAVFDSPPPEGYFKAESFGTSVALSSDGATLAVGADAEDSAATGIDGNQLDDSSTSAGAVYLY